MGGHGPPTNLWCRQPCINAHTSFELIITEKLRVYLVSSSDQKFKKKKKNKKQNRKHFLLQLYSLNNFLLLKFYPSSFVLICFVYSLGTYLKRTVSFDTII